MSAKLKDRMELSYLGPWVYVSDHFLLSEKGYEERVLFHMAPLPLHKIGTILDHSGWSQMLIGII